MLPADTPSGRVSVVGDFNGWTPGKHPLVRRKNGTRSATVALAPGERARFRYLAEGGQWFNEEHAETDGVDNIIMA